MQQRSNSLLLPLVKAGIVHLLLFILLLSSFHSTSIEQSLDIKVRTAPIIQATAISSEKIEQLVKQKQQRLAGVAKAERDRKNNIRKKAAKKKAKALKNKRKKARAEKKRKADLEKKSKADAAAKKRKTDAENKRKKAADELKRRQQQLEDELQYQLDAEMNKAREQRVLTELQKYVALIKSKISRNWIISNQTGKCILEVKLATGGFVIDIKEVGGSANICRSATVAVYKADPLPVSKDPEVFNKMRTIRLELDPQEI